MSILRRCQAELVEASCYRTINGCYNAHNGCIKVFLKMKNRWLLYYYAALARTHVVLQYTRIASLRKLLLAVRGAKPSLNTFSLFDSKWCIQKMLLSGFLKIALYIRFNDAVFTCSIWDLILQHPLCKELITRRRD